MMMMMMMVVVVVVVVCVSRLCYTFFFFFFSILAPLHTQEGDTLSSNYTSCFGVPFGTLSLALDTHARQTARKESPGRNTHRTGGKGSSGGYANLRLTTHRWHWKRVPGPAVQASYSFILTNMRRKVLGPDFPAPFFLTHRWRRVPGSSIRTANTNARPAIT